MPFLLAASTNEEWISQMRKGHPRMFFNSDTWPQIQAKAQGKAKPYLDNLLKRAKSYPIDPKSSGTGPVVLKKIKTATGSHMTSRLSPIEKVKDWGVQAAECALARRISSSLASISPHLRFSAIVPENRRFFCKTIPMPSLREVSA